MLTKHSEGRPSLWKIWNIHCGQARTMETLRKQWESVKHKSGNGGTTTTTITSLKEGKGGEDINEHMAIPTQIMEESLGTC
eukprot:8776036-Ditylum_brightwellii.AAC.2